MGCIARIRTFDEGLHKLFGSDELESVQFNMGELLRYGFGILADFQQVGGDVDGGHEGARGNGVGGAQTLRVQIQDGQAREETGAQLTQFRTQF